MMVVNGIKRAACLAMVGMTLLVGCAGFEPQGVTKVVLERDLEAGEPPRLPLDHELVRPAQRPTGLLRFQKRF